ncbi:ead/Ea22-like family protein [Pseudomonas sp. Z1-6]|uniref:ead/Ea22-like family protein n=1 Tax=Pseudomonas sp. Z1-6 TaxID=2817407 RepID=UPI003DA8415D
MTQYDELKRLAEAAGSVDWRWWDSNSTLRLTTEINGRHGADGDAIGAYRDSVQCPEAFRAFIEAASPAAVLALLAENERLRNLPTRNVLLRDREKLIDQRNELKAEIAGLKTGYQAYERVNAELKAENEALRTALSECSGSLEGEMLQKFGGQLPGDMHPVTRRDYDRDMAELAGYRAAMGKGEQS